MKNTSKVYLITQEQVGLNNEFNRPVKKKMLLEYKNAQEVYEDDNSTGVGPLYFPVGYIIDNPREGDQSRTSSWREYSKGFAVPMYTHGYPILTGVEMSNLEGRLLTVIDASFADKEQCSSIKSLIRDTIWTFMNEHERKVVAMYESIKEQ